MKIKVTDYGIAIPKRFFKGIEEVEVRKKHDFITVVPKAKEDSVFRLGVNPVPCGTPDASENLDKYIYGTNQCLEMNT